MYIVQIAYADFKSGYDRQGGFPHRLSRNQHVNALDSIHDRCYPKISKSDFLSVKSSI